MSTLLRPTKACLSHSNSDFQLHRETADFFFMAVHAICRTASLLIEQLRCCRENHYTDRLVDGHTRA